MIAQVPSRFVRSGIRLAVGRGWDVRALLAEVGLTPGQRGAGPVSEEQILRLVNACVRYTDDDLLGLGRQPVPRGSLYLLCLAVASAPDLRQALARHASFSRALPGMPPTGVDEHGIEARLWFDVDGLCDADRLVETVLLAASQRAIGWLIGRGVPVLRVELPYPEPADTRDLDAVFGEPLRFDAPRPALIMHTDVMNAPLVRTERSILDFLRNAPVALLTPAPDNELTTHAVHRALDRALRNRTAMTAEAVATELAVSVPSLRRNLRAEGTSLRRIRDDVLCRAAMLSLDRGQEPISTLAARLGFSEPSAFTRAFRRWTGGPPSAHPVRPRRRRWSTE